MAFETKPHPEWKNMLDKLGAKNYDDIITYRELDECLAAGSVKEDKRYIFERFRTELLHRDSKALESVRNVGYRIVNPNEHTRLCGSQLRKAERRARAGVDIILHVDTNKLTDKEMAQATLVATRMQNLAATLISENKSLKSINVSFRLPELPRK